MVCLGSGIQLCSGIKAEDPKTGETIFIADFLSDAILAAEEGNYDHRDNMNFVAHAPSDIKYLLAELNRVQETFTDKECFVWETPTSWAYAAACKALHKHTDNEKRLRDVVGLLSSMIYCGDKHSKQSEKLVRLALGQGDPDES